MLKNNTSKIVKIKLEPQDHEIREEIELPTKRFKLPPELNDKVQETSVILLLEALESKLTSKLQAMSRITDMLQEQNTILTGKVVKLEQESNSFVAENKYLKEQLASQEIEHQKLQQQMDQSLQQMDSSKKTLQAEISKELQKLTSKLSQYKDSSQATKTKIQADLTQLEVIEQQHNKKLSEEIHTLVQFQAKTNTNITELRNCCELMSGAMGNARVGTGGLREIDAWNKCLGRMSI